MGTKEADRVRHHGRQATFDSAGYLGKVMFSWVNPVISRCMKHTVRPEDLPPLGPSDDVRDWSDRIDENLAYEEKQAAERNRQPSVIRSLWRVFRWMLLWCFTVYAVRDGLGFLNTYFLKKLMQQAGTDAEGLRRTLVIGTLISLVQLVQIFVDTAIDFYVCRIYMRVEICLLTSLFKKVIQPDAPAPPAVILRSTHRTTYEDSQALPKPSGDRKTESRRKEKSIAPGRAVARGFQGNVFNLMFVDIPSLASLIFTFLDVAMLPVRLSLAAVMLYMQVGAAAELPGLTVVLVITAVTVVLEVVNGKMKARYMRYRDIRLDKSHETLLFMRTIRLLGWEDIAEHRIKRYRDLEMHQRTLRMYISTASSWLSSSAAMAMSVATFVSYALPFIHEPKFRLRPDLAIPIIHLLDTFIGPITDFPYAVNNVIEGCISLHRLQACFFPSVPLLPSVAPPSMQYGGERVRATKGISPEPPAPSQALVPVGREIRGEELTAVHAGEEVPLLGAETQGLLEGEKDEQQFVVDKDVKHAAKELIDILRIDPAAEVVLSSASFAWMPHTASPFSPPPAFPPPEHLRSFPRGAQKGTQSVPDAGRGSAPLSLCGSDNAHLPPVVLLPPFQDPLSGVERLPRTLHDISLQVRRGDVLLLTGPPGCGKSSVLHALLQQRDLQLVGGSLFVKAALSLSLNEEEESRGHEEMPYKREQRRKQAEGGSLMRCPSLGSKPGTTDCSPPIGYISQEAWLQIGTIKENILFNGTEADGTEEDLELYRQVVTACELHLDFETWPGGDGRFIDEGGADLSGGQRMRIAMARAVYVTLAYQARARRREAFVKRQMQRKRAELLAELQWIAGSYGSSSEEAGNQVTEDKAGRHRPEETSQGTLGVEMLAEGQGEEGTEGSPTAGVMEFSHLLCFDETFNSLDPYVAGRIFGNLFGQNGLLRDAAVIVAISEQSLSGLIEQMNGPVPPVGNGEEQGGDTEGESKHEKSSTPVQQVSRPEAREQEGTRKRNITVCCLEEGRILWQGTAEEFRRRVSELQSPTEKEGEQEGSKDHGKETAHEGRTRGAEKESIEGVLRGIELGWGEEEMESTTSRPLGFPGAMPGERATEETAKREERKKELDEILKDLMVKEQAASGQVKLVTYAWYLRRVGLCISLLFVLFHILVATTDFGSDLLIARWTGRKPRAREGFKAEEPRPEQAVVEGVGGVRGEEKKISEAERQAARAVATHPAEPAAAELPAKQGVSFFRGLSNEFYLWFYVTLASTNIFFELLTKFAGTKGSLQAARILHNRLLNVICSAPFWFYDQNPVGRVLNRLSTDVAVVDAGIFRRMGFVLAAFLGCLLGFVILAFTTFWALPVLPVLLVLIYFQVFRYYRATCREVQRASLVSFSPLCSSFSECISGRDIIFALRRKRLFCEKNLSQVENSQRAKIFHWGASSWASIRLQLLTFPLAVLNAIGPRVLAYAQLQPGQQASSSSLSAMPQAGYIGLAVSYSLSVASALRRLLHHYTHLEKEMCSVERIHEYVACTDKLLPESIAVLESADRTFHSPPDGLNSPKERTRPGLSLSGRSSTASQSGILSGSPALPFLPANRRGVQFADVDVRYRRPGFQHVDELRARLQRRLAELQSRREGERRAADGRDEEETAFLGQYLHGHPRTEAERAQQITWLEEAIDALSGGDDAIFLSPSIHRLSAIVGPTDHVGIVGRTGSGKTTLLQSLTGLLPCYRGAILLDGTRIDCLPKQVLKQVIGVLPQHPMVFKGMTVRDVLDPRHQHADEDLWLALDEVGISSLIESLPGGKQLDTVVLPDEAAAEAQEGAAHAAFYPKNEASVRPARLDSARRPSSGRQAAPAQAASGTGDQTLVRSEDTLVSSHPLSDVQLRYLALARLVLRAPSYRMILVDEPPAETLGKLYAEVEESMSSDHRRAHPEEDTGTSPRRLPTAHERFTPIPQLIRRVFAHCTVFIVAHHVASLQTCDRVWLLWKGWKIGECQPADIRTDKQLAEVMVRHVNEWRRVRKESERAAAEK